VLTKHWRTFGLCWIWITSTGGREIFSLKILITIKIFEESAGSRTNFCSRKTPQSKSNTPKPNVPTNPKQPLNILEHAFIPILWLCYKGGTRSSGIVTLTLFKLLLEHSLTMQLNTSNHRLTSGSGEISRNTLESSYSSTPWVCGCHSTSLELIIFFYPLGPDPPQTATIPIRWAVPIKVDFLASPQTHFYQPLTRPPPYRRWWNLQ